MKEIRGLTGLRGIACLYVLLYHYATLGYLIKIPILQQIQQAGYSGVILFFVLSGYLLYSLYDTVSTKYFVHRVFRTFPLYYGSLPLYLITGMITATPLLLIYSANYFSSTFTNSPLWTLMLEELFYFGIFPILAKFKPKLSYLLLVSIAISMIYTAIIPESNFLNKQMPTYFVAYSVGMYIASKKALRIPRILPIVIWFVTAMIYAGALLDPLQTIWYSIAFGLLVPAVKESKFFSNVVLYQIGKISYGIYIFQLPLIHIFGIVLGTIATFVLSFISYHLFEKRLVQFAHKISSSTNIHLTSDVLN